MNKIIYYLVSINETNTIYYLLFFCVRRIQSFTRHVPNKNSYLKIIEDNIQISAPIIRIFSRPVLHMYRYLL